MYLQPLSVEAAVLALRGDAVLVAGGTWVMRAPLRDEDGGRVFVSLAKIPELHTISADDTSLNLGALVTHHELAAAAIPLLEMTALAQAAEQSANPAIRRAATLGGNICTTGFAAADLVPALIALTATVDVKSAAGTTSLKVEDYIQTRGCRPLDEVLTKVRIPRLSGRSAHARSLLRQAGDYPVANMSVYLELDKGGMIDVVRIAVGAVETLPKRWHALERALKRQPFSNRQMADMAQPLVDEFTPRDGIDAPGWYRLRILPRLIEQVFADLAGQMEGAP
jgi:carbon-monoxide dehydrogenase medium subunit